MTNIAVVTWLRMTPCIDKIMCEETFVGTSDGRVGDQSPQQRNENAHWFVEVEKLKGHLTEARPMHVTSQDETNFTYSYFIIIFVLMSLCLVPVYVHLLFPNTRVTNWLEYPRVFLRFISFHPSVLPCLIGHQQDKKSEAKVKHACSGRISRFALKLCFLSLGLSPVYVGFQRCWQL